MKIIIYALGGGLGHATRAYKLQKTLQKIYPTSFTCKVFLSYQKYSEFLIKSLQIEYVHSHELPFIVKKLEKTIYEYKPDLWITDVFPNGIVYELPFVLENYSFQKICTVRILKPEVYHVHSEILYDEAWQIEWLPPEMDFYLKSLAKCVETVRLLPLINEKQEIVNKNLILHAGSSEELLYLKQKYPKFELMESKDNFPIPILKGCNVVTAAGCNIFHDFMVQNTLGEWYIEPFPRAYDDQFLRYKHLIDLQRWYQNC